MARAVSILQIVTGAAMVAMGVLGLILAAGRRQDGWRYAVAASAQFGAAMPATASALGYYDSIRRADSPSNLIQAQRDYFGAHTFERKDRLRGEFFHNNWTH